MTDERTTLIDHGQLPTRNLAECLAVDQTTLVGALAGQLPDTLIGPLATCAEATRSLGLSKKIAAIGLTLGPGWPCALTWLGNWIAPLPCSHGMPATATHWYDASASRYCARVASGASTSPRSS